MVPIKILISIPEEEEEEGGKRMEEEVAHPAISHHIPPSALIDNANSGKDFVRKSKQNFSPFFTKKKQRIKQTLLFPGHF